MFVTILAGVSLGMAEDNYSSASGGDSMLPPEYTNTIEHNCMTEQLSVT